MVFDEPGKCLEFLLSGSKQGILTWGFEYLNFLSGEISREHEKQLENKCKTIIKNP